MFSSEHKELFNCEIISTDLRNKICIYSALR